MQTDKPLPNLIRPALLAPGAKIGIVAPASHFDVQKFDCGVAVLKEMGFEPVVSDLLYKKERFLAGSDLQRADLINRCFKDDDLQALICARGGYGAMRMLGYLDFEAIRQHPKILVGFSDNSALLWSLYRQCGLATLHGPTVTTLGHADTPTKDSFYEALTAARNVTLESRNGAIIKAGRASGPVAGGNLATLCHLTGTPFAPQFRGHIVILEDRGEAPYRIDRMLSQMKLAGVFTEMAGLALGSFESCGDLADIYAAVADVFSDMSIPIVGGFEFGHGDRNLTLPMGPAATLDSERGCLAYQLPATVSSA